MLDQIAPEQTTYKELSAASLDCLIRCVFAHVTHEVRQPLASINNYSIASEKAINEFPNSHKALNWIGKIPKQVERVDSVLESVRLNMSRRVVAREKFSLWAVVQDAMRLAPDHPWFRPTRFVCSPPNEAIIAEGDRITLLVALTHLIQNAIEAYPSTDTERIITITATMQSGIPEISVRDQGCGTIQSELKQLLVPFFSTKTGHRGIGLNVVASVCQQFEGDIAVVPQVDGTIVQLKLA